LLLNHSAYSAYSAEVFRVFHGPISA
jgi:hypothetical protein